MNQAKNDLAARLFELVVVLVLIAVFVWLALKGLEAFRARAERVAVEEVVSLIEQSVTAVKADHWMRQDMAGLAEYDARDPMILLEAVPENYLGSRVDDRAKGITAGSWYFDLSRHALVYRIKNLNAFADTKQRELVYKLSFSFADTNANGYFDPGQDDALGLELLAETNLAENE